MKKLSYITKTKILLSEKSYIFNQVLFNSSVYLQPLKLNDSNTFFFNLFALFFKLLNFSLCECNESLLNGLIQLMATIVKSLAKKYFDGQSIACLFLDDIYNEINSNILILNIGINSIKNH